MSNPTRDREGTNADEMAKLEVEAALTKVQVVGALEALESNLRQLIAHVEQLACHVVAIEAVLKNLKPVQAIDPEAVNDAVRSAVSAGTEGSGDPQPALRIVAELLQKPS